MSMQQSGKEGGTPMISTHGKQTIAQYLCFAHGLASKIRSTDPNDDSKLPLEIKQLRLMNELKGIDKDVVKEYWANLSYQQHTDGSPKIGNKRRKKQKKSAAFKSPTRDQLINLK
jgi:hypothetical protein